MPSGDRTGPMGQGSRTGRMLGYCSGYDAPGFASNFGGRMGRSFGFGRGRGRGNGFGWRNMAPTDYIEPRQSSAKPEASREEQISMLKAQADSLSKTLKDIEKRLSDLENQGK